MASKHYGIDGVGTIVELGKGGPKVQDSSGIVEARNSANNAYAVVRGATPSGGDDLATKDYVDSAVSSISVDTTYYVDGTTGDDANDGLAWGTAKKTFAFLRASSSDAIPREINADLLISFRNDIRASSADGLLVVDGFYGSGTITIQGELTAVETFTATGYENDELVQGSQQWVSDATKSWTPDQWRRHFVDLGHTYKYPIRTNNATTLWMGFGDEQSGAYAATIYSAPEILRELDSNPGVKYVFNYDKFVYIHNCNLKVTLRHAWLDDDATDYFMTYADRCATVLFEYVAAGNLGTFSCKYFSLDQSYLNLTNYGYWALADGYAGMQNTAIDSVDATGYGVYINGMGSCWFAECWIGHQLVGISPSENSTVTMNRSVYIQECDVGIYLNGADLNCSTPLPEPLQLRFDTVVKAITGLGRVYKTVPFEIIGWSVTDEFYFSDTDTGTFLDFSNDVLRSRVQMQFAYANSDYEPVYYDEYDNTTSGLTATRFQTAIDELDANTDRAYVDEQRYGLVAPDTTTTIAFNPATYEFTLGSVGATWAYWRAGVRHVITGSKTATLAGTPPTAGTYFVYLDSTDGTLTADTNAWTLADTKVPVAIIPWDDTATPKHLGPADERHSCEIHRAYHREHHFADGSELVTGGTVSDYVVNEGAPAGDDDNTFSIAETVFYDEDRQMTCATLPDPSGAGGDCMTMTRTGASTYGWAWSDVPFVFTPAGYINWNNGGTATEGQSGKFYCTYLFATNYAGDGRFVNLLGRGEYATLSEAEGENLGLFDMTGFPVAESIVLYRFVWASDSSYTTKGKVRLAAEPTAIMKSFVTLQNLAGDKPVRVLNDLQDVTIATPTVGQLLGYNGLQWVNQNPTTSGAGPGLEFYFDNTSVIAAGAENTNALVVLATTPTTDVEGTETVVVNNNTVVCKAYLTSAALGRTTIDGGAWDYHVWAGVSNSQNVTTLQASVYKVSPELVQTVTTTGTGTTRTCTASGGSFWVAGDANANPSLAGYVQTPKGLYQITARASATEVTIATPTGYVNESTVAFSTWKYGFLVQTDDLNSVTPSYTEFSKVTVQAAISCVMTDKLGMVVTGSTTRTSNTTITWTREGATRYSHIRSPMGATHEQLSTLLGGAANDHYHFTGAQATTLGGLTTIAQGDIAYAGAGNTWSILAKSTTAGHVLTNSGSSNNPAWAAIALNDLSNAYTDATNNVLLGDTDQGSGVTTGGVDNTGVGKDALDSLTTGHSNTCFGYMAGTAITDADHCTFIGAEAGKTASTSAGDQQVGIGYLALALSNGYGNVGIGSTAGGQINSGTYNMCLGHQAGFGITTTASSTFVGASAGLAGNFQQRTGIGRHALEAGGGDDCTAVGYESLTACTAARNTAFGSFSGYSATTATDCVYLGWEAGYSNNTTGKLYIGNTRTNFLITGVFASGYVGINTDTYTGTVGSLIVKGSTNDGSTYVFVARDSDEAAVAALNTNGEWTTGSWHSTAIAYDHGGTGLTAYPVKSIILPAASAALGTTTPATRETRELTTNKQVLDVLKFAHAGVCIAWWSFLLPDSYDGGVINAKITYMNVATDSTNNFLFSLSAGCATDGNPLDLTMGTVQELETVVGDTAEDLKIGTWSTGVTPSGTPAGGKLLVLKLQRDPTDTDHDTTSLDAYVLGLRLEYTVNSWTD